MLKEILYGISAVLSAVNLVLVYILCKRVLKQQGGGNDFGKLQSSIKEDLSIQKMEQANQIAALSANVSSVVASSNELLRGQLSTLSKENTDTMLKLLETVSARLNEQRSDNEKKLEQIRLTVDEKLHKTLETRLGESFKLVSERLELVHKGLGEMQNLAVGVGDLKKALTNVTTRGLMGEIQLGNILSQILSPNQYEENVKIGSGRVEFAIKLPGKDDGCVLLPIDSKFPLEAYYRLLDCYDTGEKEAIELGAKELERAIKKSAQDINGKYITPPTTTDFAIMFLPTEGLYAQVTRRPELLESLQRDYKVVAAGPTTLAALLNSLQMGFRTLAIEKRSSEVWEVLAGVKAEFVKFGDVLEKAQKKINETSKELDTLVGTRSKQIMRKLKDVQATDYIDNIEEE